MSFLTILLGKMRGLVDIRQDYDLSPPDSDEPPVIAKYLPSESEKHWAKLQMEATKRRARELATFVDLKRVEHRAD